MNTQLVYRDVVIPDSIPHSSVCKVIILSA